MADSTNIHTDLAGKHDLIMAAISRHRLLLDNGLAIKDNQFAVCAGFGADKRWKGIS